MAGIIYFPTSSRRSRMLTRRAMVIGAAGYAAATTLGSRATAQDTATPAASPETGLFRGEARQRLTTLLQRVPSEILGGPDPNNWLFTWLDFRTHLIALGNPDPYAESTNIGAITSPLISNDPIFQHGQVEEVRKTFGFTVWDVDQTVTVGALPDQVTYYAGGLSIADLPAVWEGAGYERHEGEAGEFWTAGADGEMDMGSPVGQFGAGRMNNVAILDGDIVVFASTAEQLQQVQALAANGGASAADNEDIAALIATLPEDAVNVIGAPGAGLEAHSITPENPGGQINTTTQDLLAESDDAVGPMPPLEMAFFGITAGARGPEVSEDGATPETEGYTGAVFFANILTGSAAESSSAAEIVAWRMENMTSPVAGYRYSELFMTEFTGEEAVQGDVAALTFSMQENVAAWNQMVTLQDLWPFVWLGDA
jgi:hypothetical protein